MTDRQYRLLDALNNGGQLHLETRWRRSHGRRFKSNGWWLHYINGTIERVNDNTVWTLRDRGLIEKKDYYAIDQTGMFAFRDEQSVRIKAAIDTEPVEQIVEPKSFKRIMKLAS